MSTNRERTPTKRDFELAWDYYRAHQDYAMERVQKYHDYRLEFMRGWNEINTAAEQRGAIKALRSAAQFFSDPGGERFASWAAVQQYLNYCADQKEGDDA